MPLFVLDKEINFPPVDFAEPDGLLAIGGDLSEQRLLTAYRKGIFPWYEGLHILWWCPDPRFVLFPDELHISKSMKTLLNQNNFTFTVNQAFPAVIKNCKTLPRKGQDGTWITEDVQHAYNGLHRSGFAHSAEAWKDGELVGGLYGIRMGKVFFGESMFSKESNASKWVFIKYVQLLKSEGVQLIDCQVYTDHLKSMGARLIPREEFKTWINRLIDV
jgi:leucyl/phenylalanyl-tRNA--protein transferase